MGMPPLCQLESVAGRGQSLNQQLLGFLGGLEVGQNTDAFRFLGLDSLEDNHIIPCLCSLQIMYVAE